MKGGEGLEKIIHAFVVGYTHMDLDTLLRKLEGIQGMFLLSSFRNASLTECAKRNGWHTEEIRMSSPMTNGTGRTARNKVEVLTANCPIKKGAKPNKRNPETLKCETP